MITITQVTTDSEREAALRLFREYVVWAVDGIRAEFGVVMDARTILDGDRATLDKYMPPAGRALVAWVGDHAVGVVCLRRLSAGCGEIKRMYVRPEQRGAGVGRALLEVLIDEARRIGYRQVWLDSPRFMRAAHGLYQRAGFVPREPYPESEIAAEHHRHWLFMEKTLEKRDTT